MVPVPVPERKKFGSGPEEKKFWSRYWLEKVLGLGPGPVQKQILVPVPVKYILVTIPGGLGPLCLSLYIIVEVLFDYERKRFLRKSGELN